MKLADIKMVAKTLLARATPFETGKMALGVAVPVITVAGARYLDVGFSNNLAMFGLSAICLR